MDIRSLHERALHVTHGFIAAVADDGWSAPTPCPHWTVRDLVGHLVVGHLWVHELSRDVTDVGDEFSGDVLGADPVAAHARAAASAVAAFAPADAFDRLWPLSYGRRPGRVYARQRFIDVLVHGWDVATAAGLDPALPDDLVAACVELVSSPKVRAAWGFAERPVAAGSSAQQRLLALTGRAG